LASAASSAAPIGTAISYQGELRDNNVPLNGPISLRFRLFNVDTGGIAVVPDVNTTTTANAGRFTVPSLDFAPPPFSPDWSRALWIEVAVIGSGGTVTVLGPRQRLTPVPSAIYATNALVAINAGTAGSATNANFATSAGSATNATQLGGVAATDYPRLSVGNTWTGINRFTQTVFGTGPIGSGQVDITGPNQFALRAASSNTAGTWSSIGNSSAGGREYNLISTGSANGEGAGEFLIRDGNSQAVRLNIDATGKFGFNTTTLEEMLTASGGMTLDQANTNAGTPAGGLRFGGFSGEAIGSNRSAAVPNQFGLDLFTGSIRRLSIFNNGNILLGRLDGPGSVGTVTYSPAADLNGNHVVRIDNNNGPTGDGLAIRIANANPSAANNFVTFLNASNGVAGRIEGFQTADFVGPPANFTLRAEPNFGAFDRGALPVLGQTQSYVAPSLQIAETNIGGITVYRPPFTFNSGQPAVYGLSGGRLPSLPVGNPPFDISLPTSAETLALWCWASEYGQQALLSAKIFNSALSADPVVSFYLLAEQQERICRIGGVTYGSKGADYAEWLKRDEGQPDLPFGTVVGVRNGKISLDTNGAQQCLVVSRNPIVLGNTPDKGDEAQYEKVGFLGQVHVIVTGFCTPGDYIIASGNSDGTGIAIEPAKFTHEMLPRFIGRAWEGSGFNNVSLINTAIGMTPDAVGPILEASARAAATQAKAIDSLRRDNDLLKRQLASFEHRLATLEAASTRAGQHAAAR
jgi:hypothetical protein